MNDLKLSTVSCISGNVFYKTNEAVLEEKLHDTFVYMKKS